MSFDTGSFADAGLAADRDLRRENVVLRQLLKSADEVATRHALLLREGNHRIKNSLQIVASLMNLQEAREPTPSAKQALRTAATRIQSVARMHDALQDSDGADDVNLAIILEKMCRSLQSMGGAPLGVKVFSSADAVHLPVGFGQPIVLAVNELVVNALRHGFPNGRRGEVQVSLRSTGGQLRIVVADDGVGMPDGNIEGTGYGMKLVRMMTAQINGVLEVDTRAGTRITIVAPEPAAREQAGVEVAPAAILSLSERAKIANRLRIPGLIRKRWEAVGRG
jgi:two-component system, sensor histidine kinase PdtaS